MPFNPFKDLAFHLYSILIWCVFTFLYFLSTTVFLLEYKGADGQHAMMWIMSSFLWFALFYIFVEFSLYLINRVAHGAFRFPVLSLHILSILSGPQKAIQSLLLLALAYGVLSFSGFSYEAKSGSMGLIISLALIVVFLPALLLSLSLTTNILSLGVLVKVPRILMSIGLEYLFTVVAGFLLYIIAYNLGDLLVSIQPVVSLPIIYLLNIYFIYIGYLAYKHRAQIGLESQTEQIEKHAAYTLTEKDFEKEVIDIYRFSSANKIKMGIPACIRFVNRVGATGVEPEDSWGVIWNRVHDWSDRDFLCELAKPYVSLLLKSKNLSRVNEIVRPMLLIDRFLPFSCIEDCLLYCDLATDAGDHLPVVNVLEFAATQEKDIDLLCEMRMRLVHTILFGLRDEARARRTLEKLLSGQPKLGEDPRVKNIQNLLY